MPESPTRRRRRPALVALGVVLVLVAALASYVGFSSLANTTTVLVTTMPIAKGQVIEASHLGSLEISSGQATDALPASHAPSLVGQFATTDLGAGALITSGNVQSALPVPAGFSVVGVAVAGNQLPTTTLRAGDRIRIVSTPISQAEPPTETPPTVDAVVFASSTDDRTGMTIIDVIVPSGLAADIAARAATGRISIVLDSPAAG